MLQTASAAIGIPHKSLALPASHSADTSYANPVNADEWFADGVVRRPIELPIKPALTGGVRTFKSWRKLRFMTFVFIESWFLFPFAVVGGNTSETYSSYLTKRDNGQTLAKNITPPIAHQRAQERRATK